jgi:hypothetical protein
MICSFQVTTSAPALTVTGEPTMLIAEPFSEMVAVPVVSVMPAWVITMRGLDGLATGPEHSITPPPGTPKTTGPDREVGIALFELDPDAGADLGQEIRAAALARRRHAGHGVGGRHQALHVGHDGHDAAAVFRVQVVQHRTAIFAVITLGLAHAGTLGKVEMRPLRDSWKLSL